MSLKPHSIPVVKKYYIFSNLLHFPQKFTATHDAKASVLPQKLTRSPPFTLPSAFLYS